ncbi:MAG: M15 family metallopeptidase [Thermomicrobiales bacterium]|nr:M15 family metallopeptidase [Thermomicrobiales bacterium]
MIIPNLTRKAARSIGFVALLFFAVVGTVVVAFALAPADVPGGNPLGIDDGMISTRQTDDRENDKSDLSATPGEEDGYLTEVVTFFNDDLPAVTNLDPELLAALRQAAADAEDDGVVFYLTSGWRSPRYQNQLLQEAVATYGSEEEASRWVATANTSAHVSGDAVDIGAADAIEWLSTYGADYGLCQIYENEPWHFELRPEASTSGCPAMYPDPTFDPRMQPEARDDPRDSQMLIRKAEGTIVPVWARRFLTQDAYSLRAMNVSVLKEAPGTR